MLTIRFGHAETNRGAQDPHVLGKDQEIGLQRPDERQKRLLVRLPAQALVAHMVERNRELLGERPKDLVVARDRDQVRAELAVRMAHEEVGQAVVLARHKDDDAPRHGPAEMHLRPFRQDGRHGRLNGRRVQQPVARRAHEEPAGLRVDKLVVRGHVCARAKQDPRDRVDQARAVGTVDQQDVLRCLAALFHGRELADALWGVKPGGEAGPAEAAPYFLSTS